MIVGAVIAGLAPAIVARLATGKNIQTPDQRVYLAMGRGDIVPRPYVLRSFGNVIRDERYGEVITWASMAFVAVGLYLVSAMVIPSRALAVVALWGALPSTRRMLQWPCLLDAVSQAVIVGALLLLAVNPYASAGLLFLGMFIHERIPVWGAIVALGFGMEWWLCAIVIGAAGVVYVVRYKLTKPHPAETEVAWLRSPFKAAWEAHKPTLWHWQRWALPWGAAAFWLVNPNPWLILCAAVAYGSCLVSIDRVRTYQAVPFPFIMASVAFMPEWIIWPSIIATAFIHDREV